MGGVLRFEFILPAPIYTVVAMDIQRWVESFNPVSFSEITITKFDSFFKDFKNWS
jgi:hypothetical protein